MHTVKLTVPSNSERHAPLGETMTDCLVHVYRVKTNLKCGCDHSMAWILVWHIAEHGHDLPFLTVVTCDQIPPSLPTTWILIMNYIALKRKLCILSQKQVRSDLRLSSMGTNLDGTRRHHANFKGTEAISGPTYDAMKRQARQLTLRWHSGTYTLMIIKNGSGISFVF